MQAAFPNLGASFLSQIRRALVHLMELCKQPHRYLPNEASRLWGEQRQAASQGHDFGPIH
jgi:hypothetical protein